MSFVNVLNLNNKTAAKSFGGGFVVQAVLRSYR